ncbi:MAG: hypothetical protein JKY22_07725 [Flavobacteriaceae bacterium]|nr:hypothetical protein [Flavobacteriaceae bacterium]
MKLIYSIIFSCFFISCIPLQIAPKIDGGKVVRGKKFKRHLPNQYTYIFEDPKEANEFYHYVNAKYQKEYDDTDGNIAVNIEDREYFLTFYEVERSTQTVNLIPIIVDAALENEGYSPVLQGAEVTRKGVWYLALTVTDLEYQDSLHPDYEQQKTVVAYMEHMRKEYLSTTHYIEVYLKSEME